MLPIIVTMNKKEIIKYLEKRIAECYQDLLSSRSKKYMQVFAEGYRSRLDELLLTYHQIKNISFLECCKELGIKYKDVDYLELGVIIGRKE